MKPTTLILALGIMGLAVLGLTQLNSPSDDPLVRRLQQQSDAMRDLGKQLTQNPNSYRR